MKRNNRLGFSLLEVTISIGVVAIGLFGAIAMVPFATDQVSRGLTEDTKGIAGKNWVDDFRIRGYTRPENWMNANGTQFYNFQATQYPGNFPPNNPILIDPRQIAQFGGARNYFPYVSGVPRANHINMPRISLRAAPAPGGTIMRRAQADDIFRSHDDLEILPGSDEFQLPVQQFIMGVDGAGNTIDYKRRFEGRTSWMAMISPKEGQRSDLFTLSIIVFEDRNLALGARMARVVAANHFYSGGVSGGDVRITAAGVGGAADIDVSTGDWVVLAGQYMNYGAQRNVFQWYRVAQTNAVINNSAPPSRDITLQGPDWNTRRMPTPYVFIIPNVVAVFDKAIRLETNSIWWSN